MVFRFRTKLRKKNFIQEIYLFELGFLKVNFLRTADTVSLIVCVTLTRKKIKGNLTNKLVTLVSLSLLKRSSLDLLRLSVPTWRPRLPIDEFEDSSDVLITSGLGIFIPERLTSSSSVSDDAASDDSNDGSRDSSSDWTISGITSGSLKIAALGFLLNSGASVCSIVSVLVSELSSITGEGILCTFDERINPTRVSSCVDLRLSTLLLFAAASAFRQSDRIYRRSL